MKTSITPAQLKDTIQSLINESTLFVVCEYRGHKVETIRYTDKRTGQAASFSRLVCNVESQAQSAQAIAVTLDIPQDYKVVKVGDVETLMPEKDGIPPFDIGLKKGDKMLVMVDSAERKMGNVMYRGTGYTPIAMK